MMRFLDFDEFFDPINEGASKGFTDLMAFFEDLAKAFNVDHETRKLDDTSGIMLDVVGGFGGPWDQEMVWVNIEDLTEESKNMTEDEVKHRVFEIFKLHEKNIKMKKGDENYVFSYKKRD